jgi:hypothetical protein
MIAQDRTIVRRLPPPEGGIIYLRREAANEETVHTVRKDEYETNNLDPCRAEWAGRHMSKDMQGLQKSSETGVNLEQVGFLREDPR